MARNPSERSLRMLVQIAELHSPKNFLSELNLKSFTQVEPRCHPLRKVLIESGINYVDVANEAAFYGPKIDVQVWSAIGREFTIATNQVDFAVPANRESKCSRKRLR